jgi:hypothetical protein
MSNYPGPCAGCCTCPAPDYTIIHRSVSKSKSACAFLNSADGKYYKTRVTSTTGGASCSNTTNGYYSDGVLSETITDSVSYSYSSVETDTFTDCVVSSSYVGSLSGTCTGSVTDFNHNGSTEDSSTSTGAWSQTQNSSTGAWSGSGTRTITTVDAAGESDTSVNPLSPPEPGSLTGGCACIVGSPPPVTLTTTTAYSNEYTTADLESSVTAALPAWGAFPPFSPGAPGELASAELSTDGSSYSVMESKYQFAHQVPPNGYYKLTWIERFTPDAGGTPTDTMQSYTWDGTTPGGYDPTMPSTWPKTPVFEVDYPASNGEINLVSLVVKCYAL